MEHPIQVNETIHRILYTSLTSCTIFQVKKIFAPINKKNKKQLLMKNTGKLQFCFHQSSRHLLIQEQFWSKKEREREKQNDRGQRQQGHQDIFFLNVLKGIFNCMLLPSFAKAAGFHWGGFIGSATLRNLRHWLTPFHHHSQERLQLYKLMAQKPEQELFR